eukprot:scaffold281296_cov45-Tisochrysis_lutea.AAC.1
MLGSSGSSRQFSHSSLLPTRGCVLKGTSARGWGTEPAWGIEPDRAGTQRERCSCARAQTAVPECTWIGVGRRERARERAGGGRGREKREEGPHGKRNIGRGKV